MTFEMNWDGLNGNAFAILGRFKGCAREQGVPKEKIEEVCKEAMTGDYDHLLQTIMKFEGEYEQSQG